MAFAAAGPSPDGAAEMLRIPRVTSEIRVDGSLDDEAWRDALVVELAYEIEPGENIAPPVRTQALLSYDDHDLHLAFRAFDPDPASIRARLSDRDDIGRDDFVGLMIDPFNDERRGFLFYVNPLGVQSDAVRNDVGNYGEEEVEDATWDAIWSSTGQMVEEGYVVEMSVPFSSLRFPRSEGERIWGIHLVRSWPRNRRHLLSARPIDRNRTCLMCQAAKVAGFSRIDSGGRVEIDPTITGRKSDDRDEDPAAPLDHGAPGGSLGATVRWSLAPSLALLGTLNPDFSQVEADVAQLTINTRFELFYPEKRPFFLEGADLFTTPLKVVYSRTITDPAWGAKISGKEGGNGLGLFVARDDATGLIFPSNQESDDTTLEQANAAAVLRYRRDFGRGSTIGLLATDREGEDYHNRLYGADGFIRLTESDRIRFQWLRSDTVYPDAVASEFGQPAGPFDDNALSLRYFHGSRDWTFWGSYEDIGEDFRADLGFLPRVDTRRAEAGGERVLWGDGGWYSRLIFGVWGSRVEDHRRLLTDDDLGLHVVMFGPRQSMLFARAAKQREYFEGAIYNKTVGEFNFNIRPTGDFTGSIEGRFGDAVDYDNGRPGRVLRLSPGLTLSLGRHLHLWLNGTLERLEVGGGRLYEANLTQGRLLYQFTRRTFARTILQYADTRRDPSLYLDPVEGRTRELLTQFLFSYKVNPLTLFYAGYSDSRSTEDRPGMTLIDRALFVKLGFAWIP